MSRLDITPFTFIVLELGKATLDSEKSRVNMAKTRSSMSSNLLVLGASCIQKVVSSLGSH